MTHLRLTPEEAPSEHDEVPDVPGDGPAMRAPGPDEGPDAMDLAEAEHLERLDVERAADEGMVEAEESLADPTFEEEP
jgi:hypothetical protein